MLALAGGRNVIQVADPTGVPVIDRANIEAAIGRARPGDIVLAFPGPRDFGVIADNLVQGNSLEGTAGIGLLLLNGSRTRITNNVIQDVRRKPDIFPELQPGGIGIFLGPESDRNELDGNVLRRNEFFDIVLLGDRNVVRAREANDTVLDLGRNNEIETQWWEAPAVERGASRPQLRRRPNCAGGRAQSSDCRRERSSRIW